MNICTWSSSKLEKIGKSIFSIILLCSFFMSASFAQLHLGTNTTPEFNSFSGNIGIGAPVPTIFGANAFKLYVTNQNNPAGIAIAGIGAAGNTDATGVYGMASEGTGVSGITVSGTAIYGEALNSSGYAGNFQGKVRVATHLKTNELEVGNSVIVNPVLSVEVAPTYNFGAAHFKSGDKELFIVPNLASSYFNGLSKAADFGIIFSDQQLSGSENFSSGLVIAPWNTSVSGSGTGAGIRIAADGNVGVGIREPQEALDVNGSIRTSGNVDVLSNIRGLRDNGGLGVFSGQDDSEGGYLRLYDNNNTSAPGRVSIVGGIGGDIRILNRTGSGWSAPNLTIKPDGMIGIGTNSPSGTIEIRNKNTSKGIVIDNRYLGAGSSSKSEISFRDNGAGRLSIGTDISGDGGNNLFYIYNSASQNIPFQVDTDGWVSIEEGGLFVKNKVQIGLETISTNGNEMLTVDGAFTCRQARVTDLYWSDFVFDPDYKLMSLEKLHKYINKHRHLPDLPSEDEVKNKGINLGEMDALLLQKIEELTLYIIELKGEINTLKTQIKSVEK